MGHAIALSWQVILAVGKDLPCRYLLQLLSLVHVPADVSWWCGGLNRGTQYMRLGDFIVQSDLSHFFGNDLEGHDHVREDDLANFFPFFDMEALGINDAHLLQDCGFSRFAGT